MSWNEGRDVSDDVLLEIFLFLPAHLLLRFRFVCKYWFNLITSISTQNPRFVQMHFDHHYHTLSYNATIHNLPIILSTSTGSISLYSLNNNNSSSSKNNKEAREIVYPFKSPSSQLQILGSCNGLLCIQVTDYNDDSLTSNGAYTEGILCLWNPCTNEFKQVPHALLIEKADAYCEVTYGFGYDRLINDYKLVTLVRYSHSYHLDRAETNVYTLGTNSWKRVDKEIPDGLVTSYSTRVGLFLNGVLHWISTEDSRIYSFNIEDEEFRVLPEPAECFDIRITLHVLRGCLCISYPNQHRYEVWMMMDYGVQESWTKLFTSTATMWMQLWYLEPLWICKNGEVLMGNGEILEHLHIYDPNNDTLEPIDYQGVPCDMMIKIVHIGSLVSLKSGTYLDQEHQAKEDKEVEKNEKKKKKKNKKKRFAR